jgi:transposase
MLQRKALSTISGNRQKGHELTPNLRGKLTTAVELGLSCGQAGKIFKIHRETVQKTCQLEPQRVEGHTKSRAGRPKKTDNRDI